MVMHLRNWPLRVCFAVLLGAAFVPLIALTVLWVLWESEEERSRQQQEVQHVAMLVASQVGESVAGVQERLAVLARLPAVRAGNREEAETLFRELLPSAPHLQNIGLVAPDGTVLASGVPLPSGRPVSLRDREWLQRILRWGEAAVGGFQMGRITGNPTVILAHPVLDGQDRLAAVLFAALDLAYASQAVTWVYPGIPLLWAVVDEQGLVLLHSQPEVARGKPLGPLPGMIRGETIVPGTRWHSVVGMPEELATARVRQAFLRTGLPAGLVLFLAAVVGFWIAYNTWRPLQALADAVRRSGRGEAGVSIPVEGAGEVAQVARAFQEALETRDRRYREVAALLDAARIVASSLDLEQTLQAIVHKAASIAGVPAVRLFLVDEQAQVLRWRAGVGVPPEVVRDLVIPIGESFSGQVATTGKPLAASDTRGDPRLRYPQHAMQYGLISYLGLPVKVGDRVIGVLVFNTDAPRVYREEEIAFLSAFADQAAIALENARLYGEIERHAEALETRVKERTAALEEALRVKVEFLAMMSHELRTPLNFILGFADLLTLGAAGPLTPKQVHYVDRIRTGGRRLLSLVTDILGLAQVEAGSSRLHLRPVRLGALIQEVLEGFRVQADQKRLSVSAALDTGLPEVLADRGKLARILANLVGNAVKFTPEGGTVTVRARTVTAEEHGGGGAAERSPRPLDPSTPRQLLEIAVEDTGIGIPAEDLERIFVPFYQVDSSGSRAYGGAGVGLPLVRQLVEAHGGRVWAESAGTGRGARFVVRMPLRIAADDGGLTA